MQYYASLPAGWSAGQRWPVVVVIDGANHDWLAALERFEAARGALPFIIAVPLTLANANHVDPSDSAYHYSPRVWDAAFREGIVQFDFDGVRAMLSDLREQNGAEDRYFMTGWSAGGILTWATVLQRPEQLVAAAPACANFVPEVITSVSAAPERARLPVKAFQGAHDPARSALEAQFAAARQLGEANGFAGISNQLVGDETHSACPLSVMRFFEEIRSGALPAPTQH